MAQDDSHKQAADHPSDEDEAVDKAVDDDAPQDGGVDDEDIDDEGADDDADYTYFCAECGHEQFDGDECEVCGCDDWEFVRLDEEGLRRLAESRGEDWRPGAARGRGGATGRRTSLLTEDLEASLDVFLDDLVEAMYGDGDEAGPDDEAEAVAGTETPSEADDGESVEAEDEAADIEAEASLRWKRLVAEETFREWVDANREWLVHEVLQSAPVGDDEVSGEEVPAGDE